jgi:hypothetical protein
MLLVRAYSMAYVMPTNTSWSFPKWSICFRSNDETRSDCSSYRTTGVGAAGSFIFVSQSRENTFFFVRVTVEGILTQSWKLQREPKFSDS